MSEEVIAGVSFENVTEFYCFGTTLKNDNKLMIELEAEGIRKCIPGFCMGAELNLSV
jgi:hypothetical protein